MLRSSFPSTVAVASPRRRTGWTAPDGPSSSAPPSPLRIPIPTGTRCRTRKPSASLDVGSEIDASDSRTGDELRLQLNRLQEEAESTRSKANNARMRLMRLSEVAEQLQKQAASKVKAGKEDDARELLFQKKKIVLALQKSKNRVERLDKLSAKLNEAILLKETELIGNVSLQSLVTAKDTDNPIHVVPPRMAYNEESQESEACESFDGDSGRIEVVEPQNDQANGSIRNLESHAEENLTADIRKTGIDTLIGITTCKGFLKHVDGQLEGIQDDLVAFLRLSNLGTRYELRPESEYLQDMQGILHDISSLRKRIERIIQIQNGET